ncbi:cellulase family glycosylhydrolase [Herbivorax sp. ANBcel31]|uniref:cellulase family glycosylhydrolase n=1 Tax=Herbivorax sp. ANBcel31 TaxID=3069754 RepID=UPI0027B1D71C|nr:cellulase family glycosylhydrolase [Herbivorax sp. ANBcel31]MDQ2087625.1 cellulase family glycosylhydrolase [Herbivorax sp. ANBcel31]
MKCRKSLKKIVAILSLMTLLATSFVMPSILGASSVFDEKTASETVDDMGIGWNLGNTLEACGDWINGNSVRDYETAWGNPITTQEMIDGIKDAGFSSVRIPVAWSNLIEDDYTINEELMNRVEEVVDYCSNNDMYAVVNIHWDGGWFEKFSTEYDESMKKYTSIWTQISNHFKDYPHNLMFESLNEEGVWDDVWNRWSGEGDKTRAYNILNDMNQEFVDIVRESGGNNASRCLLIAGYATDIDLTIDDAFRMPNDTISDRLIIKVHYYNPSTFTILTEDADWGEAAYTWGTEEEINQLVMDMEKMKKFSDNGYPVVIGEYGCYIENKDPESVRRYISMVTQVAYDMGYCPMLWDNGTHYSRNERSFRDPELAEIFLEYKDDSDDDTSTVLLGDINGDGNIDSTDYTLLRRHILGSTELTGDALIAADVNGDGVINSDDCVLLTRYLLEIINEFPQTN